LKAEAYVNLSMGCDVAHVCVYFILLSMSVQLISLKRLVLKMTYFVD